MPVVDTKFELCRDVEYVLKIGRDYQNKDGFRGAHYDTVKLLCDTIEYLRDKMPKPDPDWNAICERCHEGEIEPKECKYYGEPNGCNSPIYGEHPKEKHWNAAAMRDALIRLHIIAKAVFDKQREGVNIVNLPQAVWHHCEKALSSPPRNCDVGTAEEQAERFSRFCQSEVLDVCSKSCPLYNHSRSRDDCAIQWEQMPYSEGGSE